MTNVVVKLLEQNKQLNREIRALRKVIAKQDEQLSEQSWRLNPDRMGGQYTPNEYARAREEWR